MLKQKVIKPNRNTRTKLPQLRNLKVTSATADDPIYSVGFVLGGKRLLGSKQASETRPSIKVS